MKMFDSAHYETYESDALVLICVVIFLVVVVVSLLNMRVAQLTCAYEVVYANMIGYVRLERIVIIVGIMPVVTLGIYQNPVKMVDDVSALGLRHVGSAIPTVFQALCVYLR